MGLGTGDGEEARPPGRVPRPPLAPGTPGRQPRARGASGRAQVPGRRVSGRAEPLPWPLTGVAEGGRHRTAGQGARLPWRGRAQGSPPQW